MAVLWILTLAVTFHQGETCDTRAAAADNLLLETFPPLFPETSLWEDVRLPGCLCSALPASPRVSLYQARELVRVRVHAVQPFLFKSDGKRVMALRCWCALNCAEHR